VTYASPDQKAVISIVVAPAAACQSPETQRRA